MSPPPIQPPRKHEHQHQRPQHHHRDASFTHSVFTTSLLGTPPASHSQLLPPPPMYTSPMSPAQSLPSLSPTDAQPVRLRPIRELGIGAWAPSPRLDGPLTLSSSGGSSGSFYSSSSSQHQRGTYSPGPSALSTPSMTTSPDLIVTPSLDVRGGFSDAESDDAFRHWEEGRHLHHQRHSPLIRQARATGAPSPRTPDIGKSWWNTVVVGAHNPAQPSPTASPMSRIASPLVPLSPTQPESRLHQSTSFADDEDVDELDDDQHDRCSLPPMITAPGTMSFALRPVGTQRSVSSSPRRRPSRVLPPHMAPPRGTKRPRETTPASASSNDPSPSGSTISLPSKLSPTRRTKPNHLNRKNVPLYNRSKAPKPGNSAFTCGYVPPLSDLPHAMPPSTDPCGTTALKKADMERHYEEIHARDEAERVIRNDLEIERAGRFLVDMATQLNKIMRADPLGHYPLPTPYNASSGPDAPASSTRYIRNVELRAQAENVRLRVSARLADPAAAVNFDFVENSCTDFRDIILSRLPTYRIWRCTLRGCAKPFGSQRSLDRHLNHKHAGEPIPSSLRGWYFEILGNRASKEEMDVQSTMDVTEQEDEEMEAAPVASSSTRPLLTLDTQAQAPTRASATPDRPTKRRRTDNASIDKIGLASSASSSSVTMRVRQQTPEQRSPEQFGFQNRPQVTNHGSVDYPIKVEDVDGDLLALAEGNAQSRPSQHGHAGHGHTDPRSHY